MRYGMTYERRVRPQERRELEALQEHIERAVWRALVDVSGMSEDALWTAQRAAGRAVRAVFLRSMLDRPQRGRKVLR